MAWLTKSRFTAGLQCTKRLWNEVHEPLAGGVPDSTAFMNGAPSTGSCRHCSQAR